ncbi:MAG TPA: TRAP transporter substrate-binding protein DctP [Tepidimicrobium sp.]|nr:TRAP transporter substrate-binding protein DctP [Tepidimicrobium sp.]
MKNFKKILSAFVIITLMATVLAGCTSESKNPKDEAGNGKSITLRMSQASAADGAIGLSMEKFAELIHEKTDGRYTVETFHNGQLGSERDNIEAVQMDNLDIAVVNQAPLSNFVPEIGAVDLPYVITSYEHADNVFLGEIGDGFLEQLADHKIQGLTIWESGFRNLTNSKKEVNSVEDVKGLRIRVMENKIHQDLWRSLGADPVAMAWGDAYTALQQGAIDGQENPATVIDKNNVGEVNKNMAITEHVYSTVFIIMSPKTWNSLTPEDQDIFKEAALEAGLYERELSRKMDQEAISNLEGIGVKVTYPDKQGFIDATEKVREDYGKEFSELLKKIEEQK